MKTKETEEAMQKTIEKYMGRCGKMLSASKSYYYDKHPNNLVAFNGNLIVKGRKVWWGDVDATAEKDILDALAKELNESVYVLREMDARFDNEKNPLMENAIYVAKP
jgi:hypothetical protein